MSSISRSASEEQWAGQWAAAVDGLQSDVDYQGSADQLRSLVRTGLLRFTDIRDRPERFFEAHRLLALHSPHMGPGFFIRFTVQMNLFGGTIVALASDSQLSILEDMQAKGQLGCFGLTEKFAGVNSGLVVNTTIEWNAEKQVFELDTPDKGAEKNWISQGYVADKALVVANLSMGGKVLGPHAFVMDLRSDGKLVAGVHLEDMGRKTVGNDLDNAAIRFDKVQLPKSALLNRYAEIDDNNQYVQTVKGVRPFDMIGQRLFTGRVAVAQAALGFSRGLYNSTQQYAEQKQCWGAEGAGRLAHIPQLKALFAEADERLTQLETFAGQCETELSDCLRSDVLPAADLVQAIAVAKVLCVEDSISLCFRLKQEVGSYALMAGTGFEQSDFLQCCKFAEGDSRILMLKMARDRLRHFQKAGAAGLPLEDSLCGELVEEVGRCGSVQRVFDDEWQKVYSLAGLTMQRIFNDYLSKATAGKPAQVEAEA